MGMPPLCPIADPLSKMRYHKYPWTPNPSSGNTYIKHFRSSLYHLPPPTSSGFNKFRKAVKICIPIRNHTLFLCGIRSYRQVQQKQNSIKTRMPHRKILSYRTVFYICNRSLTIIGRANGKPSNPPFSRDLKFLLNKNLICP